ncbi:TatD family hydrolase [Candidatus Falkowbacteria bacterium]|nr:TatD family hydrolase [Candidatus Falkowbacteria bacterium]
MFDTHAHVNFNAFKDDADQVIKRALERGVAMINVGAQFSTSKRALEMARNHERNVYAAIGLHPIHLEDFEINEEGVNFKSRKEEFDFEAYRKLGENDKVVAIGESGLDYYRLSDESRHHEIIEKQKQVFIKHTELANALILPLIVHCRGAKENMDGAYEEILAILKKHSVKNKGVMHCYIGAPNLVKKFLELGFYIGFNGVLTFDKTGRVEEVLRQTPMERILLETDCPYLTPAPKRGQRNEPMFVEFVARKAAEVIGATFEEVVEITDKNAKELFNTNS